MVSDQHSGRRIDQVGNFLLSRLCGTNGVSTNSSSKKQQHADQDDSKAGTADSLGTAATLAARGEASSSRRKSPPVPAAAAALKLEPHSNSSSSTSASNSDTHRAKCSPQDDAVKTETAGVDLTVDSDSVNVNRELPYSRDCELTLKMEASQDLQTVSPNSRSPVPNAKDEVDMNLNRVDPNGAVFNGHSVQSPGHDSSDEDSMSATDFSIRKVNLQQNLRRVGQVQEPRIRAIHRYYRNRSSSVSPIPPADPPTGNQGVTSPCASPHSSPSRLELSKVFTTTQPREQDAS